MLFFRQIYHDFFCMTQPVNILKHQIHYLDIHMGNDQKIISYPWDRVRSIFSGAGKFLSYP